MEIQEIEQGLEDEIKKKYGRQRLREKRSYGYARNISLSRGRQ